MEKAAQYLRRVRRN